MNKVVVYSATLAVMLPLTSAFADNWERQKEHQQMMMERQAQMQPGGSMAQHQGNPGQNRERELERGGNQSVDYIESLPASAAGNPDSRNMDTMDNMNKSQKVRRGEVVNDY